jgi:hypothetical protein
VADDVDDEVPDFWELSDEVAMAALPGLLAAGLEPHVAAHHAYIAAEHYLLDAKDAYVKRILARFDGAVPVFTRDAPHDPGDTGV